MSDPLVPSNPGVPTPNSLNNVNAVMQTACSFLKLKTGPASMPLYRRKCLHVLVDTGNRCGVTLINELIFRSMSPTGELESVQTSITGAGQKQFLTCVGRPKEPLELQFYDKESKNALIYRFRPLVIRNLQLPLLLSSNDLARIGAVIDVRRNIVTLKTPNKRIIRMPLTDLPTGVRISSPRTGKPPVGIGHSTNNVILGPNEECVFQVAVSPDSFAIGDEVSVEMTPEFKEAGLLDTCVVDRVRKDFKVHLRAYNATKGSITVPRLAQVAMVASLQAETIGSSTEENCNFMEQYPLEDHFDPKGNVQVAQTRRQITQRIASDLKFDKDGHDLSHSEKEEIVKIFLEHRAALALSPDEVGTVKGVTVSIPTGTHPPVSQKCRPLNKHMQEKLREQISKWLQQAVISPCNGPWASPIVPVPKKDGRIRFAVDYRRLNAITTKDSRPVANLNEKLASLKSPGEPFKYFATLDLSEAYHCVKIKEEDQEKTAMITPLGLYKFNRMSFGLTSAPQAFHQVVTLIEKQMYTENPDLARSILLYFDDCIIGATSFADLKKKLTLFLKQIADLGLKINPAKCEIGLRCLKWLGHTVSEKGIQPDKDRVAVLDNWPEPKTLGEIRAVHGLLSYFRKFIRNFAARSQYIRGLLKAEGVIHWTVECQKEFEDLRAELKKQPILGHPDFTKNAQPFVVTVDTSSLGTGSVLSQVQKVKNPESNTLESKEVIICYASRRLTVGERSYSSYKLELAGLVSAIEHFRFYIIGRKFLVRTDNKALSWLLSTTNENAPAMIFRWQQMLQGYDFGVEFISGAKNRLADALSRKGYNQGDYGDMQPPLPHREPQWESGQNAIAPKIARSSDSDDVWIPVMKQKFEVNAVTRSQETAIAARGGSTPDSNFHFQNSNKPNAKSSTVVKSESDDLELEFTEEELKAEPKQEEDDIPTFSDLLIERQQEINDFTRFLLKAQQSSIGLKLVLTALQTKKWPSSVDETRRMIARALANISNKEQAEQEQIMSLLLFQKRDRLELDQNQLLRVRMKDGRKPIVVPYAICPDLIRFVHRSTGSNHVGQRKTIRTFSEHFYAPKIHEKIQRFVETCAQCQDGKRLPQRHGPGLGKTTSIITQRLARFYVDCVKLTKGKDGHQYVFTLLDASTRWFEAFPMRQATSRNVARILEQEIFPRYGYQLLFISDQGKEFKAKLIENLMKEYAQKHYFGTAYHPNSNSVERAHRSLVSALRAELADRDWRKERWVECLPRALATMRMSLDESDTSAFSRVFGLPARTEVNQLAPTPYDEIQLRPTEVIRENDEEITIRNEDPETGESFDRTLQKINDSVFAEHVNSVVNVNEVGLSIQEIEQTKKDVLSERTHRYNKEVFDRKSHRFIPFKNELVDRFLIQDEQSMDSRKFQRPYDGPYLVMSADNQYTAQIVTYNLETGLKGAKEMRVYSGQLRPTLTLSKQHRAVWKPPWHSS